MFIVALFAICRTWKQPKFTSVDEWVRKMWCMYTMEYYSAIKMNNNAVCSNMDGPRDYHTKWTLGAGDRQGGLVCCDHRVTKSQTWLSDWTELNWLKVSQTNIRWYHLYVRFLSGTNELNYKTEIESQMQKINLWLPEGGGGRDKMGNWDWKCTLLWVK